MTDGSRPLNSILIFLIGCVAFARLWSCVFTKQGFPSADILQDHIILQTSLTETTMFLFFKNWSYGLFLGGTGNCRFLKVGADLL